MKVEKAEKIGFCLGVKRAIDVLEKVAWERGGIETLGAVVHNQQVLDRLARIGVKVARNLNEVTANVLATSSHGISPLVEQEIKARGIEIISTTCPFVNRAQVAARRLAEADFFVVIYGEADHPEVKGIMGWTKGNGIATLDEGFIRKLKQIPRRIGILSQTTQIPAKFMEFVRDVMDVCFARDSEMRVIDTICHDIRERQAAAIKLANKVDLMLVVGGHSSANTNRLAELCSRLVKTHLVETAAEIEAFWLKGKKHVGITAGASTAEQDVDEVFARLKNRVA